MAFWEVPWYVDYARRLRDKIEAFAADRAARSRKQGRSKLSKKEAQRLEERSLNTYALWQAYVLMGVTGLGYLALTWSTVVLLGGFVTALGKKDFWCLTAISMIQAARIFNDLEDHLFVKFLELYLNAHAFCVVLIKDSGSKVFTEGSRLFRLVTRIAILCGYILAVPVLVGIGLVVVLYSCGAVICVVLSSWRIGERDYGSTDGDGSKANLTPALDIFYTLVICQAVLYFLWLSINLTGKWFVYALCEECKFPEEWGRTSVVEYLYDTRAKCWKDPASIGGKKLINYAVDALDSESWQDYLSGVRMLDVFIEQGVDVRLLLLPSRPKVQKLIDTLGWRSSGREIREIASRIVACLAGDIHLNQFPGAIRCISSLLDTTLPYSKSQQQHSPQSNSVVAPIGGKQRLISSVKRMEERRADRTRYREGDQQGEADSQVDGQNELIFQGLTILEKLASDQHNCRDICSTHHLLEKITTPIYSDTLIQHINRSAWTTSVVKGSFRVVHKLIHAPGRTGRRLRREISSNKQALRNLEMIIDESNKVNQEVQVRAIEILTELAADSPTNLAKETKEYLIEKQLQIFFTDDEWEEPATKSIQMKLKVTAGKTLALLSKTGSTSVLIMSKYNYIADRLIEILDAKSRPIYRTIAAEILENLCTHHTMDKEHVKNTLLPKVLEEVLPCVRKPIASGDDKEIDKYSSKQDDEENQLQKKHEQIESSHQASETTPMTELQGAFLSLTLVICDKLISTDDFDFVDGKIDLKDGEFAFRLRSIIQENCQATPDCLRIVKLCGQIAVSMMRHSHSYTAHFKDQQFVESLSKASEIMSNLEICMVFAGTDRGAKKTAGPLLSDLTKEALELVGWAVKPFSLKTIATVVLCVLGSWNSDEF